MSDILALARAHGRGPYKKKGAEYHGECPNCGGKDRHWLTPTSGIGGTGFSACRQCEEANCNALDFGVRFCGLSREEARIELGLADRKKPKKEGFNPLTEGVEVGRFDYPKADGLTWLQKRKYRPKKGHRLHGQGHEKECLW